MKLRRWNLKGTTLNFGNLAMTGVHTGGVGKNPFRLGRIAQAKAGHLIVREQPPGDEATRRDLRGRKADTWPGTKSYTAIVNVYEESERTRQERAKGTGKKIVKWPTEGKGTTKVTQTSEKTPEEKGIGKGARKPSAKEITKEVKKGGKEPEEYGGARLIEGTSEQRMSAASKYKYMSSGQTLRTIPFEDMKGAPPRFFEEPISPAHALELAKSHIIYAVTPPKGKESKYMILFFKGPLAKSAAKRNKARLRIGRR